jgi:hypothetical protein
MNRSGSGRADVGPSEHGVIVSRRSSRYPIWFWNRPIWRAKYLWDLRARIVRSEELRIRSESDCCLSQPGHQLDRRDGPGDAAPGLFAAVSATRVDLLRSHCTGVK